jgi:adrenodoxin-NADP+ reductase
MYDAFETAEVITEDITKGKPMLEGNDGRGADAVLPMLHERGTRTVSYDDWKKVEAYENELGHLHGKPREKLTRLEDVLNVIEKLG